jgi:tight adherence protein C
LDYLVLQVEAAHSVQQALRTASGLFINTSFLHKALRDMDDSMRVGSTLTEALTELKEQLDTPAADIPIQAISQAIRNGTPLGKILREQSKSMRADMILNGEHFANILSVKILIPLLFFIFPASFLVIFSPVIVSLAGRLP